MSKTLKYSLIAVVCLIIITEILFRIFFYEQLKTRHTTTNKIPDSLLVFTRKPNGEEHLVSPSLNHKFRINNHGFIGHDFKLKKHPDTFRIIFVGNSNTASTQMNSNNNYCTFLQDIFDNNGFKVEVLNCAREGAHKDIQNLNSVKYELINFDPDLILFELHDRFEVRNFVWEGYKNYVLEYNPHDPSTRKLCKDRVDRINKSKYLTIFYDASFIIRALCKKYIDKNSDWDQDRLFRINKSLEIYLYTYITKDSRCYNPIYYYTWDRTIVELKNVIHTLDSIDCDFVLINGIYSEDQRSLFRNNGIKFLELSLFQYSSSLEVHYKLDGHLNETGHALQAERIFSMLILHNQIPKKYYPQKNEDKY